MISRRNLIRAGIAAPFVLPTYAHARRMCPILCGSRPYLGPVATGAAQAANFTNANNQMMVRRYCVSFDAITQLKIGVANWYFNGSTETGPGSPANFTWSVEYPAGTIVQGKTGGNVTGTIPNGSTTFTDFAPVNIPANTPFWIRIWWSNPSGINYFSGLLGTPPGEAMNFGPTVADQTLGGTVTNLSPGNTFGPGAIVGMITKKSAYICGDSIAFGQNDFPDATGRYGIITRGLTTVPFLNGGVPAQAAFQFAASHTNQAILAGLCSEVICQLAVNDLNLNNRTPAQLITSLTTGVYPVFAGKKIWQTTCTPVTSSLGNAWQTPADQTEGAGGRIPTFNTSALAGLAGTVGTFDVASIVTDRSLGTNLWITNSGTPRFYTIDGLHGTNNSYGLVGSSGIINQAALA